MNEAHIKINEYLVGKYKVYSSAHVLIRSDIANQKRQVKKVFGSWEDSDDVNEGENKKGKSDMAGPSDSIVGVIGGASVCVIGDGVVGGDATGAGVGIVGSGVDDTTSDDNEESDEEE